MNITLAAGGTGGHMVPAHALAAELKARGHGVMLVTDDRGARIPGLFDDVPTHLLPAGRLGGGPIGFLKAVRAVLAGRRAAKALYKAHKPDVVVGEHRTHRFQKSDRPAAQSPCGQQVRRHIVEQAGNPRPAIVGDQHHAVPARL